MDVHRIRRLATTLVASQLRSGRSSSNPRSFFGQPRLIGIVDVGLFLAAFFVTALALRAGPISSSQVAALGSTFLPFLPIVAVGVVLVAGLMFELTTTAKFAGSDAANWLPIAPFDYLLASVSAIAYTYSPAVAIALGAFLPIAWEGGVLPVYLAAAFFSVVALVEGAVLVEMVRAVTQRAGSVTAGRRGGASLLLRAFVLVLVILLLQFAFNPVFLLGVAQHLSAVAVVTLIVPFFWSTEALTLWVWGDLVLGLGFAVAQLLFVAGIAYLASDLREQYWSPAPAEVRLEAHRYAARNRLLSLLGLSSAESAIVAKDLKGLVRRREMLPTLVVPIVLGILVLLEGTVLGGLVSVLWVGWVAGFFALLVSGTSIGQERRAIQSLYAFPISSTSLARAKAAFVLLPSVLVGVALSLLVGVFFRMSPVQFLGVLVLVVASCVVLTFWGLAFAARYSDFQERPRPQFMRPAGMLAATGSGMALLFAIVVPGAIALFVPTPATVSFAILCAALVLAAGGAAVSWTLAGFRQLFRELPF